MRDHSPHVLQAGESGSRQGGASFSLRIRLERLAFMVGWLLLARWTPPQMRAWRRVVLRMFGAKIAPGANIYSSARIWYPPFLEMGEGATLGPRVRCYNQAPIRIGAYSIISQDASLCAGSHLYDDPDFQLVTRPISIGEHVWIAAEAFVGPGVKIADYAVLGARGVAMRELTRGGVYSGNPAVRLKQRKMAG